MFHLSSWYQTLPGPKLDMIPVMERLPRRAEVPMPKHEIREELLDDARKRMITQRQERLDQFIADKKKWLDRRAEDSVKRAAKNKEYAADVRKRFMASIGSHAA